MVDTFTVKAMPEIDQSALARFRHQAGIMRFLVSHAEYTLVKLPIARHWRDIINDDPDRLFDEFVSLGLFREASIEERLIGCLQKPELQAILRKVGKKVSGTKKELVSRILEDASYVGELALPIGKSFVASDMLKIRLPELQKEMDSAEKLDRISIVKINYDRVCNELRNEREFFVGLNFQPGRSPCSYAEKFVGFYPTSKLPVFPPTQCTGDLGCSCFWEVVDRDELKDFHSTRAVHKDNALPKLPEKTKSNSECRRRKQKNRQKNWLPALWLTLRILLIPIAVIIAIVRQLLK